IADDLQVVTPSLNKIMDSIKARGFKATRTVINPKGVKTDAPSPLVVEVIKEISDR
ncbi:MAG: tRNA (guanine(10)-N(2))-dimethyltransferase, partial [archaeon]|nr:tRNA (guanine(10)-N(2))-dimethyltransferase [archaeon]